MKYDQTAAGVLAGVGGEQNVSSLAHCATRLRFQIVDRAKVDKTAVERTPGVIAVVEAGGQFQVVIGNNVPIVFAEIGKISSLTSEGRVVEGGGGGGGNIFNRAIELISSIFSPILWALAGAGILKAFLALFVKFGWLTATTQGYTILYAAADATFNFLPILLAVTAAKRFKANQFVSLSIAGALVYPTITALYAAGTPVHFFGIPVVMVSYVSSVLPIILAVWVQSMLERALNAVLPSAIRNFTTPMLVVLVVVPLTFLVIGPISHYVGSGLSSGVNWVWALSPVVGGAIMGGLWQVFVIFGVHWGFVPVMINDLSKQGYSLLTGPLVAAVLAQGAATAAVALRTKNRELKELSVSAAISGILAGITEPAIYGVTLRLKRPFIYGCIGGAVGGAIASAGGSAAQGFVVPGLITLSAYTGVGNFTLQVVGTLTAMSIAFFATLLLGFQDVPASDAAEEPAVAASETSSSSGGTATLVRTATLVLAAPVSGRVVALADVPDAVFSSGALGEGAAVLPTSGLVTAPLDGVVATVMPHAYGIRTEDGVEVLVHVGIDTVRLDGEHFSPRVAQGQSVRRGDLLGEFDPQAVRAAGYDPLTVVVVTAAPGYSVVRATTDREVGGGAPLVTLEP